MRAAPRDGIVRTCQGRVRRTTTCEADTVLTRLRKRCACVRVFHELSSVKVGRAMPMDDLTALAGSRVRMFGKNANRSAEED